MNGKKTVELSLKELFIVLLRKWWIIVLCTAVVAAITGATSFLDRKNNLDELYRRYYVNLDAYNQEIRANENVIKYLTDKKNAGEIYNKNSILMHIDPFNMRVAYLTLVVNAARPADISSSFNLDSLNASITNVYRTLVTSIPLSNFLPDAVKDKYSEYYLRELVNINAEESSNQIDTKRNVLTLKAVGNEDIDPLVLLNNIFTYLQQHQDNVSEITGDHYLASLGAYETTESDAELAKVLSDKREALAEDSVQIKKLEDELDKIRSRKPALPSLLRGSIRTVVINSLIAAVIFSILVVAYYIVFIPIQTDEQIQWQTGIRYLKGGLYKRGKTFIGRWGDKLSGVDKLASEKDTKALIQANIKDALQSRYDSVLLTGCVAQTVLDSFVEELSVACKDIGTDFIAFRDVANNPLAIEALSKVQAVLFVERIDETKLKKVYRAVERVRQSDKIIIGYTLL